MARFGQDKLAELRERADIVEVIGAHVRLRRAGRNYVGLCPFHNEKTPSFSVNAERGFFHCFGCGAGGTVFDFVMRQEGLSFPEAVRSLAKRFGVAMPETQAGGPGAGEREAMLAANEVAAAFFSHVLWQRPEGAPARDYLKSRGITEETARAFALGFAPAHPGSLGRALARRNLLEAGIKGGLVRRDNGGTRDLFIARLMFPIRDGQGRVIAFGGRVLDQRLPKYINSPESLLYSKGRSLYGLYEARQTIGRADSAIVVEGYFDVIAVWQAGFKEVVASLGTSLTVDQLRFLSRYSRNVIACFDGDEAGRKASLRALEVFLAAGLLGRSAFIPSGFDPDTLIRQRGAETFADLVANAELLVDFYLRQQAEAAQGSLEDRARAAERVAQLLRQVANPFEFDLLARKAADLLGIGEEVLRKQARQSGKAWVRPASATGASAAEKAPGSDAADEAELGILALAILRGELRAEIAAGKANAEFDDPILSGLVDEVCRLDEAQAVADEVLAERLSAAQRGRLSEIAVGPLLELPAARALLADYLNALRRRVMRREVEALRKAAIEAGDNEMAARQAQALIALRRGSASGGDAV